MHNKLCYCFWRSGKQSWLWQHTPMVARILREI